MVNAWAVTNHMVFGQLRTAKKSNEITAIPELLERLDLTDCTVSIDATCAELVEVWGHKPKLPPKL